MKIRPLKFKVEFWLPTLYEFKAKISVKIYSRVFSSSRSIRLCNIV